MLSQWNLSMVDMLYSVHLSIADTCFENQWSAIARFHCIRSRKKSIEICRIIVIQVPCLCLQKNQIDMFEVFLWLDQKIKIHNNH